MIAAHMSDAARCKRYAVMCTPGGRKPRSPSRPPRTAYTDALLMLARREFSEAQIRHRLSLKQHTQADIDSAAERLKEERAIDDGRVAGAIARMEIGIRGRGRARVKQTLEAAGIAARIAQEAVDAAFAQIDGEALLERALGKRLRGERLVADDREFQRLYRYLVRQGFEPDQVFRTLSAKRERKT